MATGESQSEKLPVTTSSIITESKGTFMGIDGIGFLYVVGVFVVSMMVLQTVGFKHAFPTAIGIAVCMFFVMRYYLTGKPDNFLRDVVLYPLRPKIFEHRPRSKAVVLKKDSAK